MIFSGMCKSKLSIGKRMMRFLMMPCEILLRDHLSNTRIIDLLGSVRVSIGVLVDVL